MVRDSRQAPQAARAGAGAGEKSRSKQNDVGRYGSRPPPAPGRTEHPRRSSTPRRTGRESAEPMSARAPADERLRRRTRHTGERQAFGRGTIRHVAATAGRRGARHSARRLSNLVVGRAPVVVKEHQRLDARVERELDGVLVGRVAPPRCRWLPSSVYVLCHQDARAKHELDELRAPVGAVVLRRARSQLVVRDINEGRAAAVALSTKRLAERARGWRTANARTS